MLSIKYPPEQILFSVEDWKKPSTKAVLAELADLAKAGSEDARNLIKSFHQRFISLLAESHKQVIAEYATGTGKTGCGTETMKLFPGKWLIVYYRIAHKETWLKKPIPGVTIEFAGYGSLKSKIGKSYTGIILDECHHISPASLECLKQIHCTYAMGLSALIPSEKKALLMAWKLFHTQKLNTVQAIKGGLLPPPKIIACGVHLNNTVRDQCYRMTRYKKAPWDKITYSNYLEQPGLLKRFMNYEVWCTQQEYYDMLNGDILFWKGQYFEDPDKTQWKYIKWQRLAGDRKRFLSTVKHNVIKAIHDHVFAKGLRFVVFEIDSTAILKLTSTNIVSHKNKDNAALIKAFNEGKIDKLYSVDILNESSNLEILQFVLLGVLNTIQVANIQRFGRSLRGEFPILAVPYVAKTSDEKNFRKFITGLEEFVYEAKTMREVKTKIDE